MNTKLVLMTLTVGVIVVAAIYVATGRYSGNVAMADGDLPANVPARVLNERGELAPVNVVPTARYSNEQWSERLTDKQFYILREKGTERAGTGALLKNKDDGLYVCAGCSLPLFDSATKFESGTGWPSFYAPVAEENVLNLRDTSHGMLRTENVCARCGGHLGHVFRDGPQPTGLRYCMNSESLRFVAQEELKSEGQLFAKALEQEKKAMPKVGDRLPAPELDAELAAESGSATAVFAGGCFWCTEAVFEEVDGVSDVVSGYIGGTAEEANYEAVCSGTTGHAEAIKLTYDPSKVTYGQLLRIHFATHNPTEVNRQGPDRGPQYRTAIFPWDEEQEKVAAAYIKQLDAAGAFSKSIATKIEPKTEFFEAEDYHQDFAKNNPKHGYIQQVSDPKVEKLRTKFPEYLR